MFSLLTGRKTFNKRQLDASPLNSRWKKKNIKDGWHYKQRIQRQIKKKSVFLAQGQYFWKWIWVTHASFTPHVEAPRSVVCAEFTSPTVHTRRVFFVTVDWCFCSAVFVFTASTTNLISSILTCCQPLLASLSLICVLDIQNHTPLHSRPTTCVCFFFVCCLCVYSIFIATVCLDTKI